MDSLKNDPGISVIGTTTGSPTLLGTKLRRAFGFEASMPAHSPDSLKEVLWRKLGKVQGNEVSKEDLLALDLPSGGGTHNMDTLLAEVLLAAKNSACSDDKVVVTREHLEQGFNSFAAIPSKGADSAIQGLYA